MEGLLPIVRSWSFVGVFVLLLAWETFAPFFPFFVHHGRRRLYHGLTNIGLAMIHIIVSRFAFLPVWIWACQLATVYRFGLLNWLQLPTQSRFVMAILCLDLFTYWWHWVNHRIPFLWRFHRVHHSDMEMDVTSANRFHVGEIILSSVLRVPVLLLLGARIEELVLYEACLAVIVQFHHANISISSGWDNRLQWGIPTPFLHKVHHSTIRNQTNSNYGALLSVWDRFFGTLTTIREPERIEIGLHEYREPHQQGILYLLKMPFIAMFEAKEKPLLDSTDTFTDRVEQYAKYRPSYPPKITLFLKKSCGLTEQCRVADIGSGTGISSKLFLKTGCRVYGVEPNEAMRRHAEESLAKFDKFVSIDATAEATTLDDQSIDFLVAGQAFHYFQSNLTRTEFKRILRPEGWLVFFWNQRPSKNDPFARAYEKLLRELVPAYTDQGQVSSIEPMIESFVERDYRHETFKNFHVMDFEAFVGRARSSSYFPQPGHPNFNELMQRLRTLYERHNERGHVTFEYLCHVYMGRFGESSSDSPL